MKVTFTFLSSLPLFWWQAVDDVKKVTSKQRKILPITEAVWTKENGHGRFMFHNLFINAPYPF